VLFRIGAEGGTYQNPLTRPRKRGTASRETSRGPARKLATVKPLDIRQVEQGSRPSCPGPFPRARPVGPAIPVPYLDFCPFFGVFQ